MKKVGNKVFYYNFLIWWAKTTCVPWFKFAFPGFRKGYESLQMLTGYLVFLFLCTDSSYPLCIFYQVIFFYVTLLKLYILWLLILSLYISKNLHHTIFNFNNGIFGCTEVLVYLWSNLYIFADTTLGLCVLCRKYYWSILGSMVWESLLERKAIQKFLFHNDYSLLWNMLFHFSQPEYFGTKKLYIMCKFIFLG